MPVPSIGILGDLGEATAIDLLSKLHEQRRIRVVKFGPAFSHPNQWLRELQRAIQQWDAFLCRPTRGAAIPASTFAGCREQLSAVGLRQLLVSIQLGTMRRQLAWTGSRYTT
jgi:hypothetical protein